MVRKLYYSSASPYARIVRIVLHELNVDFESDRLDALRPMDFGSINPGISIPVFMDDELILFDSKVICQYLFDTYEPQGNGQPQPPLLSCYYRKDQKWHDLKLLATLETLTESLVNSYLVRRSMNEVGLPADQLGYLHRHHERLKSLLGWLDSHAAEDGFVAGHFSLMDIQLISALGFADARDIYPWRGYQNLESIVALFADRHSIQATVPERKA